MRYLLWLIYCCAFLSSSCSETRGRSIAAHPLCSSESYNDAIALENITILVNSDQHGSSAIVKGCIDYVLSADFSKSKLFESTYSPLLNQMLKDSITGGAPTEMTVSAHLRKKRNGELRDTLFIERIIRYRLH